MKNKHNLLIVERSSSALTAVESDNKDYVLEGVFGQIDQKNRNNRIYTESEYVPQIEALQSKIASSKLLGELDHPTQFDTSLKNVSHIIEELFYDKDTKEVRGKIRLLDTEAGKQAKALVDAGVPLQISSRAAGAVESNGEVKIKQLFTYDLVADPGFENAELTRVNESYGYENDNSLYIYEMHKDIPTVVEKIENTNTQIKENQKMADFVKAEDFNKYSEYLANEIKSLKESMGDKTVSEDSDLENLKSHNNHIVENVKTLSEYVEHVAEMLDNSIQYTEHVAEKADQGISYSETLAEKLDESISYTEHVSEAVAKVKDFANYLAEAHNEGVDSKENLLEYVEYLKENLQAVSEYTEYIAESLNEEVEEEAIEVNAEAEEVEEEEIEAADAVEGEEVAKEVADEVEESEDPAKEADEADETEEIENIGDNSDEGDVEGEENGVEAEEVIASDVEDLEEIGDNAPEGDVEEEGDEVLPAEDIEDESVTSDSEIEDATTEVEAGEGEEEAEGEDGALDPLEAYKNEISSKLDKLVESATIKDNENPSFFRVVSSTTREKYNSLNESAKTNVRNTVSKRGFMTESEIVSLMTNSELILESAGSAPFFINKMPAEYTTAWENLSEAKKNQITAQSQYHTLKTEYQVANFWQTRDLREAPVAMEKVAMVNEAKEETKTIGYDVTGYGEAFKKRFNK